MPVSSSIYSNIGQGVTPLEDPQNALLRALKMQGAQEEMQAQRMTRARTEEDYRRGVERSNRLQQLMSGEYADEEAQANALVRGGFIDEGQKILKGRADYLKTKADARKTDVEILDKSLGIAKSFVPGIRSREAAAAYLEGLYSDPVLGPIAARLSPKEMALQNIPTDPQQLERWKAGHMSMTADKLMELSLPKLLTSDVGNAKITTGYDQFTGQPMAGTGQRLEMQPPPANPASDLLISNPAQPGQFMPNQPLIDAKKKVAAAGAARSSTTVVNQGERAFATELGKLDAKELDGYRTDARTAQGTLSTVRNLRESEKNSAFSGGGANQKLAAANFLNGMLGVNIPGLVGSQTYNAEASKLVLDKIKTLGANPSNADREFIEKTVPQLSTSPEARAKLTDWMEKQALKTIKTYESADAYARKNNGLGGFKPPTNAPESDLSSAIDAEIARRAGGKR
jgi:hypothetical protein